MTLTDTHNDSFELSGISLTLWGNQIAGKMFPHIDFDRKIEEIPSKNLQAIAFSIVGLLLMVFAIPDLVGFILNYHAYRGAGDEIPLVSILDQEWDYALRTGIQYIGYELGFICATNFSSLLHKTYFISSLKFESEVVGLFIFPAIRVNFLFVTPLDELPL